MIKKIYLAAALFFSVFSFLEAQQSNLVVFSDLNEPFTLLVNNQRVNQLPSANIKVTGLTAGWYTLRMVFNNPAVPQAEMSIGVEANREITYAMVKDPRGIRTLMFVNEFTLGYNPIPHGQQFTVTYTGPVMVNPNQGINNQVVTNPNPVLTNPNPAVTNPNPVLTNPNPVLTNPNDPVTTTQTTTTTTIITNDPSVIDPVVGDPQMAPDPLPGYNGPVGCTNMIDQQAFLDAKESIDSKSFSSSKMSVAKQVTRSNCLLASQVKQIMSLFDYETDRLNYAKFAYDYTYDQGNYYKVNDAFDFESSIRSLQQFLEGR